MSAAPVSWALPQQQHVPRAQHHHYQQDHHLQVVSDMAGESPANARLVRALSSSSPQHGVQGIWDEAEAAWIPVASPADYRTAQFDPQGGGILPSLAHGASIPTFDQQQQHLQPQHALHLAMSGKC